MSLLQNLRGNKSVALMFGNDLVAMRQRRSPPPSKDHNDGPPVSPEAMPIGDLTAKEFSDIVDCIGETSLDVLKTHLAVVSEKLHITILDVVRDRLAKRGLYPLHLAATKEGRKAVDMCKYLLDIHIGLNEPDDNGKTPLYYACEHGRIDPARLLLDNGAQWDHVDHIGDELSALHIAARCGHVEMVDVLLKHGCHVDARTSRGLTGGLTPLHFAAQNGKTDVMRTLIEADADVNALGKDGLTALEYTVMGTHIDSFDLLIASKCKIKSTGKKKTVLRLAADVYQEIPYQMVAGDS